MGASTRTWTATDECGNAAHREQVITVADGTPPVVAPLPDISLEDREDVLAPDVSAAITDDLCSAVTVTHVGDVPNDGAGTEQDPLVIERVYRARGECGNEDEVIQWIAVTEVPPPDVVITSFRKTSAMKIVSRADSAWNVTLEYCTDISREQPVWLPVTHTYAFTFAEGGNLLTLDVPTMDLDVIFFRIVQTR